MNKKRNYIFGFAFFFSTLYLLWRIFFTLPFDQSFGEILFGIILLLAEIITTLTSFELYLYKIKNKNQTILIPDLLETEYPDIDIFIVTHNESPKLLYQTINACTFLQYPDPKKIHIYVCDDSNRLEIKQLAKHFNVNYLGFDDNKHAKAGNLNYALSKTTSPYIATFDADMIVKRTFLMETIPYFFIKDKNNDTEFMPMGLVQTPQSFYNQDLFQFHFFSKRIIPNEQDFFSKEINVLKNANYAAIYTGSNALLSRKAINDIGGFPYHTITEDFETSIRLQKAGYMTYSTKESLAAGLSTTTISSMIKQRTRWARGVIQSLQNTHALITPKLNLVTKLSYFNAFLYWWSFFNRMIFILAPILFALFDLQFVDCSFIELLIFWLPSYIFYHLAINHVSGNVRNLRWNQIIDTILAPFLIIPVLLESLGIRQKQFKVTNKKKQTHHTRSWLYMMPHFILVVLTVIAIIRYSYGKYGLSLLYSSIILFWLVYNLIILCFAIFFMLGRPANRKHERIEAKEEITVYLNNHIYQGVTLDLSQVALAFQLFAPIYIPSNTYFEIEITTANYHSKFNVRLLYVRKQMQKWIYVATIKTIDEKNKRQYLQIIHDRKYTLPDEIDEWSSLYDDLYRNLKERFTKRKKEQRQTFRIPIEKDVLFSNQVKGHIIDFNYHYFSIKDLKKGTWNEKEPLTLTIDTTVFYLRIYKKINYNHYLFEITNFEELMNKKIDLLKIIKQLIDKEKR